MSKPAAKKAVSKPAAKKAVKADAQKTSAKSPAQKSVKPASAATKVKRVKEPVALTVPIPGQVIDFRGGNDRGKTGSSRITPRVVQSSEPIVVPEVGGVIDFRPKRQEAQESRPKRQEAQDSRPKRQEAQDSRPKRQDSEGSRPKPQELKESGPNREEKQDSRSNRAETQDSHSKREEKRRDRPDGNRAQNGNLAPREEVSTDVVDAEIPQDDAQREKPPAKDITVVVMGLGQLIDTSLETIEALHAQKLPWETEILVMAPRGRFDFPDARIFKPRNVNNVGDVMDYAVSRANSDIVVFVDGNVLPRGERWLVDLTDPFFEESSVGLVDCSVVAPGVEVAEGLSKTYHRHDKGDERLSMDGAAFAVRKSVAMKNKFDAGEGTREDWIDRILSSGFTRRHEGSIVVERGAIAERSETPRRQKEASPESFPTKAKSPAQKASPKVENRAPRKRVVPPPPVMHKEEAPPLWQLPMQITQRTAEKFLQIAMDKKQRTLSSVILAPVDATREVLGTYRKAGLPIPSILTKDD